MVVAHGRTRSLVEKFEKGRFSGSEDQMASTSPEVIADRIKSSTMLVGLCRACDLTFLEFALLSWIFT